MNNETTRVLLVDDSEDEYNHTRKLLSEIVYRKHDLDWVTTHKAAVEVAYREHHDVYLIAHKQGSLKGLVLLQRLRQIGSLTPAILLVCQENPGVVLEALNAGAADYIVMSKIGAAQLERSIRYSIERGRAEQARTELIQQRRQYQRMKAMIQEAGRITHDFSNLLTSILCHTQIGTATSPAGSLARNHFEKIQKSADQAATLTKELHNLRKTQTTLREPFNTNEVVMDAYSPLRYLVDDHAQPVAKP